MDNLTSSQQNPDSSLGLHPALGFHQSPAQPGTSSACSHGLQKPGCPGIWADFSLIGWESGEQRTAPETPRVAILETPPLTEESEVGQSGTTRLGDVD